MNWRKRGANFFLFRPKRGKNRLSQLKKRFNQLLKKYYGNRSEKTILSLCVLFALCTFAFKMYFFEKFPRNFQLILEPWISTIRNRPSQVSGFSFRPKVLCKNLVCHYMVMFYCYLQVQRKVSNKNPNCRIEFPEYNYFKFVWLAQLCLYVCEKWWKNCIPMLRLQLLPVASILFNLDKVQRRRYWSVTISWMPGSNSTRE